ncbi:hypothetical protein Tco_1496921 [Tanacetum coccineum]
MSLEQTEDLDRNVTYDEIKRAVWDCGTNKSPGLDGFTFVSFVDIGTLLIKMLRLLLRISSRLVHSHKGPFMLNELLSWSNYKRYKAMIFKVDFEKGFSLVRWDYIDDVLKLFGFSYKWRGWINGRLKAARHSVLLNGSPTSEF